MSDDEKPVVVFDKSFAEGTRSDALRDVASRYVVVVTSSFYYEVFSTLEESRKRVFAGFPEFRRVDSRRLCKFEQDHRSPAESVEAARLYVNPNLISGKRVLTFEEESSISDFEASFVRPRIAFWSAVMKSGVIGFAESEVKATVGDRAAFEQLCSRLLRTDFIQDLASQMGVSFADLLDPKWFTFRSIQAKVLHGLTLRFFYPSLNHRRSDLDLEHDVHDIDYLTLGLHAGSFATNESLRDHRKLGWKFKFLRPDGRLLQSISKDGRSKIIEH